MDCSFNILYMSFNSLSLSFSLILFFLTRCQASNVRKREQKRWWIKQRKLMFPLSNSFTIKARVSSILCLLFIVPSFLTEMIHSPFSFLSFLSSLKIHLFEVLQ